MNVQTNSIQQLCKEYNLKTHFNKIQQSYTCDINMALYMDLNQIQNKKPFQIINVYQRQDFIINFYGFRLNLTDDLTQKLYKHFIKQMDPLIRNQTKKKYSILFFDCSSGNKKSFDVLKQIYKKLPALYFAKLNKIYDIEPGFLTKSFGLFSFSSWAKLFNKHVQLIQRVQSVQQISELKIYNILCKCPKQITKNIKVEYQNPTKMIKSAILGSKIKPFDCLKKQFKQYLIDQKRGVPLILSILIQSMKQHRQCCQIQGIFRSAGSIEDQQNIVQLVDQFKTFRLLVSDQHCKKAISGVIKKIFTQSASPLIPYQVYNDIMNSKIQQHQVTQYWSRILHYIPKLNRQILCYVTEFLRQYILTNKEKNKMNTHNLSVVFNPCFFRPKQCTFCDLKNSGKFAALFKVWLEKYEQIMQKVGDKTHLKNYQQKQSLDRNLVHVNKQNQYEKQECQQTNYIQRSQKNKIHGRKILNKCQEERIFHN